MTSGAARRGAAPARSYVSPRRQEQAAQTRAAVLGAGSELFATRGWAGTGMRDVAGAAGVAVETVYANFRSKAELLQAALNVAVVGDAEPLPLAGRPEFTALAEGPLEERAAAAARLIATTNRRTARLAQALREAATSDGDLAQILSDNEQRRRINVHEGAELVAGRPLSTADKDGLWAVCGSEPYLLLRVQGGWSDQQYEIWVATLLVRLLGA